MSLTQGPWKLSAPTGSQSTIVVSADHTTIEGYSYGYDKPIIPDDEKSFTITILPNDNLLVVTLVSPGPNADRVQIFEKVGTTFNLLDDFMVDDLTTTWQPTITGV